MKANLSCTRWRSGAGGRVSAAAANARLVTQRAARDNDNDISEIDLETQYYNDLGVGFICCSLQECGPAHIGPLRIRLAPSQSFRHQPTAIQLGIVVHIFPHLTSCLSVRLGARFCLETAQSLHLLHADGSLGVGVHQPGPLEPRAADAVVAHKIVWLAEPASPYLRAFVLCRDRVMMFNRHRHSGG